MASIPNDIEAMTFFATDEFMLLAIGASFGLIVGVLVTAAIYAAHMRRSKRQPPFEI